MSQTILGLGGLLGDAACAIVHRGGLAAAIEQSKVSRQDRPGAFPEEAFQTALQVSGLQAGALDCIAVARPFSGGLESADQLRLRARFPNAEIVVVEHHHAHAASAFYASGFSNAAVVSADRAGDFRSTVLFQGEGRQLTPVRELYYPDSLADLFSRVTELLGYEPRADEHKIQWLSTFGEPKYLDLFRAILHSAGPSWPRLDRSYFDADRLANGGFSSKFFEALGAPVMEAKSDIAASLQAVAAETLLAMFDDANQVCLAGGLGFNALLVRALEDRFQHVFVQPAAGNAGTAIGAALYAWHNFYRQEKRIPFTTLCLGPSFAPAEIKRVLENCKLRFRYLLTESDLIEQAVATLNDNKIVAWMQGRMEFGPRALGNRSILASPLNPYSTENLNVYIKHRESYRKFAASVPVELADEYFEVGPNASFLATVGRVKPKHRDTFQAAILGSDLIRVHTVRKDENPIFHTLLTSAGASTGLPVLYNTSFNLFGDPLVCTPRDAVRSFYSSGIDVLFAGSFMLEK
jgi:carbamoyltransferase